MGARQLGLRDVRQGRGRSRLRLLAPLRYLRIIHPEKTTYDVILPVALAVSLWIAYLLFTPTLPIFGDSGVLRYTRDLLIMAVPFTIGALAAVAMGTPGKSLDRRPPGAELWLDGNILTLRQFVCFLLGFLSFMGLSTLIGDVAAVLLRDSVVHWCATIPVAFTLMRAVGVLALFLMLSSLTTTVFWSLYFLSDVVNREPSGIE